MQIFRDFVLDFPLRLKVRVVHIRKKSILCKVDATILIKISGFTVNSKPKKMTIDFSRKFSEAKKYIPYWFPVWPSTNVASQPRVRKSHYWGETLQFPHPLLWRNETTCSVTKYALHPSTLNTFLCTPSAVGAAVSASLCSEHVNQTSYWRSGEVTSPSSDTMCHSCAPVV